MKVEYDKYYQTENLFGNAYPELIDFFTKGKKGSVLDVGCGQGRDSIALAFMGYDVTGIDYSQVGIDQLNKIAKEKNLPIVGMVEDIYAYKGYDQFEYILIDSMFHFGKKEKEKEVGLMKRILSESKPEAVIIICIQDVGKKVEILDSLIADCAYANVIEQTKLVYIYEDQETNHRSETNYQMLVVAKRL